MSERLREIFALLTAAGPDCVPADTYREELVKIAYDHKCAAEYYSAAERETRFPAFRAAHLQLTTDELHAAKERYRADARNAATANYEAILRDIRSNTTVRYEERDGTLHL